jgi:carbon monoxide dehydrogenase subunit G
MHTQDAAWTTETWMAGMPREVIEVLTDPEAIARWAPIGFQVLELEGERLETGSRARVGGGLAGRQLEFVVDIREAHERCLSLVANGPCSIEAEYQVRPIDGGSSVRASISVSGEGVIGGVLARSVDALLAAGALNASVARIGREFAPESVR